MPGETDTLLGGSAIGDGVEVFIFSSLIKQNMYLNGHNNIHVEKNDIVIKLYYNLSHFAI